MLYPCHVAAQLSASLDGGLAQVSYQGYLGSSVFTLAPAVGYLTDHASIDARGIVSLYRSGNASADGQLRGSAFTALGRYALGEVYGTVGATQYRTVPSAENGRVGVRAYAGRGGFGGWAGVNGGFTRDLGNTIGVEQAEAGGWLAWPFTRLTLSLVPTRVGPVSYVDVLSTARLVVDRLTLSAILGTRPVGSGNPIEAGLGDRVSGSSWGQFEAAVRLAPSMALVGDVGSSPTDYVRHVPAVHYVGIALRLTTLGGPPSPPARDILPAAAPGDPPPVLTSSPVITTVRQDRSSYTLRLHVPSAHSVELMGDFTNWRPVRFRQVGDGDWQLTLPRAYLPSGPHRFNIRTDAGPWMTPGGITIASDDFGSTTALLVVP